MRLSPLHVGSSPCGKYYTLLSTTGEVVYFTVYLSTVTDVASEQIIPFDTVESNVGNGYDVNMYKFRPPYNGTYEFTLQIRTNKDDRARAEISVNGQRRCRAHTGSGQTFEFFTNYAKMPILAFSSLLHENKKIQ